MANRIVSSTGYGTLSLGAATQLSTDGNWAKKILEKRKIKRRAAKTY